MGLEPATADGPCGLPLFDQPLIQDPACADLVKGLHRTYTEPGLERRIVLSKREMSALAAEWGKKLNIKAIDSNARVVELSGGNQQKVVIGKSLIQRPRVIIFDEPTRSVDVGAPRSISCCTASPTTVWPSWSFPLICRRR
jgi:ABC-type uncharacterized transport system ATPase subunit